MSSIEMPACFLTSGSVRTSVKIQSPYCPSVVQVFCPLTTHSSPSLTARVRSEARSEPASGSEKPWLHQMSRLAVGARKRSLSSSLPNCASTGPIIEVLKASGGGTLAACISSFQMCRWSWVQSWPPYCTGQCGTAYPPSLSARWEVTMSSLESSRPSATLSRISCGTAVVKNSRILARNSRSSSDSCSCMSVVALSSGTAPGGRART